MIHLNAGDAPVVHGVRPSSRALAPVEGVRGVQRTGARAVDQVGGRGGQPAAVEDPVSLSPEALRRADGSTEGIGQVSGREEDRAGAAGVGGFDDPSAPKSTDAAAKDASAESGKESGVGPEELSAEEEQVVQELRQRDAEVRAHEQAHASKGGSFAGSPTFEYETGPDGRRYAVGGEVSIDVAPVAGDPAATARKMEAVRAAATAPAEPSAQDRAVAAAAAQELAKARAEVVEESRTPAETADASSVPPTGGGAEATGSPETAAVQGLVSASEQSVAPSVGERSAVAGNGERAVAAAYGEQSSGLAERDAFAATTEGAGATTVATSHTRAAQNPGAEAYSRAATYPGTGPAGTPSFYEIV